MRTTLKKYKISEMADGFVYSENEVKKYFNTVIDWISVTFTTTPPEMCGLEWGRLYEEYHKKSYDSAKIKKNVYARQTAAAKKSGKSNCPLCAIGHDANKKKIWELKEMDADHVAAWSKGGKTDIKNCRMLCRIHNQAKGNK